MQTTRRGRSKSESLYNRRYQLLCGIINPEFITGLSSAKSTAEQLRRVNITLHSQLGSPASVYELPSQANSYVLMAKWLYVGDE